MAALAQDSLPITSFYNGGKARKWHLEGAKIKSDRHTIPITDVISVRYIYKKSTVNPPNPKKFQLVYAKNKKRNIWRPAKLSFRHDDINQVILWVQTIQHHINRLTHRPKQILLFVNPYGGKKRALKIYENYAKPLFQIAGVDVSVIISQRRNQIRDIITHNNFDNFDAVACIGGDGTAAELFTGLILRECELQGVKADDQSVALPKPELRVGIIPGGSTDTTTYGLHGTTDAITAILHIIMGISRGLDLVSVHNDNRLLQIYSNVTSYGFLGDTAYFSEKLRWMGPTRYEYIGLKKILKNEGYKGTISILCDEINEDEVKCFQNCNRCSSWDTQNHNEKNKWITIAGNFFLLAGANMSCAGDRNPNGLAPYCHLGDGYLNVLVVHHTSLFTRLKTLQRFTQSTYSLNDLSHVEVYRAREFYFEADGTPGRWNCDGEVIQQTDIHAKVHRQLVSVYGRGAQKC